MDDNTNNATKLDEYLFLNEQMGWHMGMKLFEEKGGEAIEKEL